MKQTKPAQAMELRSLSPVLSGQPDGESRVKIILVVAVLSVAIGSGVVVVRRMQERQKVTATKYVNPFDRNTYVGQWHEHNPSQPQQKQSGRVHLDHIRFLASEADSDNTMSRDELISVCDRIVNTVNAVGSSGTADYQLLVQATLGPGQAVEIQLASRGDAPGGEMETILGRLADVRLRREIPKALPLHFQFTIGTRAVRDVP